MADCKWQSFDISLGFKTPLQTAKGPISERHTLLLKIEDDRAQGWGEASPLAGFGGEDLGDCLAAIEAIPPSPAEAYRYAVNISEHTPCAAAAIVGALADHQARVRGIPLALQMAASQGLRPCPRLRCNALLPKGDVEMAVSAQAQGFGALKWKSCGHVEADAENLKNIRKAVGPGMRLRIDANGAWTQGQTQAFARLVTEYDLDYVEQPLAVGEEAALAYFTESKLRIALDESAADLTAIATACDSLWAEVLVIKAQWLGGYPALRQALNLAKARHPRRVVVTSTLDSAVGRAHALHATAALGLDNEIHGLASGLLLANDVGDDGVVGGRWELGKAPGIGFDPQL